MARKLTNKTNVAAPDSVYPFGRIKDKTSTQPGTPVNEDSYGDFHQFFEKLMAASEITANDLPDNAYNGFQLFQALKRVMNNQLYTAAKSTTPTPSVSNLTGATSKVRSVRVGQKIDTDIYLFGTTSVGGSGCSWTVDLPAGFEIKNAIGSDIAFTFHGLLRFPVNDAGDDYIDVRDLSVAGTNIVTINNDGTQATISFASDNALPNSTAMTCWVHIAGIARNIVLNEKDY